MSTQSGARHLAESANWLAWEREMSTDTAMPAAPISKAEAREVLARHRGAYLYEVAACHDGQPAEEWRRMFVSLWQ